MRLNFNKIVCINLKALNAQQLFAVCETYKFGFEALYKDKKEELITIYWLTEGGIVVAFVIGGYFRVGTKFNPLDKTNYEKLKNMKPTKTPKTPNTDSTLNNYVAFLNEGYEEIRTPSMDKRVIWRMKQNEPKPEITIEYVDLPVILDVDSILAKITEYGIGSMTEEERKFLDNSVK
jgi:hypothetical protein